MGKSDRILRMISPNPEEDAEITAAALDDPDNLPLTDEDEPSLRRLSPDEEAAMRRRLADAQDDLRRRTGRPPLPEAEKKRRVTMYLDPDVVDRLKEGGRGWQTRANQKLREALGL